MPSTQPGLPSSPTAGNSCTSRLYQRSWYHLFYLSPDRGGEVVRRRRAGEGAFEDGFSPLLPLPQGEGRGEGGRG